MTTWSEAHAFFEAFVEEEYLAWCAWATERDFRSFVIAKRRLFRRFLEPNSTSVPIERPFAPDEPWFAKVSSTVELGKRTVFAGSEHLHPASGPLWTFYTDTEQKNLPGTLLMRFLLGERGGELKIVARQVCCPVCKGLGVRGGKRCGGECSGLGWEHRGGERILPLPPTIAVYALAPAHDDTTRTALTHLNALA